MSAPADRAWPDAVTARASGRAARLSLAALRGDEAGVQAVLDDVGRDPAGGAVVRLVLALAAQSATLAAGLAEATEGDPGRHFVQLVQAAVVEGGAELDAGGDRT